MILSHSSSVSLLAQILNRVHDCSSREYIVEFIAMLETWEREIDISKGTAQECVVRVSEGEEPGAL